MSTVAYKHSLRHHVPSGHSQHSPPPSPPETPKSATASLKSHGSKREKVKETVDHLLHKFHIPHHHHHVHEHSSQDTPHAPVTPEKKSLLAKRASFAASLRPGSLKRKSVVADVDVPTLNYKTSPTLSASSSLHDDRHSRFSSSGSSNTAAEDEPVTGAHEGVESPKSLKSSSRLLAPSSPTKAPASDAVSTLAKKTTPISATAAIEPPSKPTAPLIASDHHHHSKREAIKDAADHVLHKLHIPHHHHSHPRSASFTESTLTSSSSFSAGRSSDESDIPTPAASAEVVIPEDEEDELATTLPKLPLDVDDVFTEPRTSVAEPAKALEEHVEPAPEAGQVATAPTAPTAAVNAEKSVDAMPPAVDAPLVETKVLVESTTQTDDVADIPLQDIPRADHETSLIPSRSIQTTPHSTLTFAPRKSTSTPITIPTYIELRKATEAHRRTIKAEKPSWIRYIYGSFIKPVVVVAVECTVAAVCYGLVKVLERRPQALKSDQLKLA